MTWLVIGYLLGLATRAVWNAVAYWFYYRRGDDVVLSDERRLMMIKKEAEDASYR